MIKILATVWHTGANYALRYIMPDAVQCHLAAPACNTLRDRHKDAELYIIYRDPLLVGASWGNRYWPGHTTAAGVGDSEIFEREYSNTWADQWLAWREAAKEGATILNAADFDGPLVKSHYDRLGLHAALRRGDMDFYHYYIPKRWIALAQEAVDGFVDN